MGRRRLDVAENVTTHYEEGWIISDIGHILFSILWAGIKLLCKILYRLCIALISSPCSLCIVLVFAAISIGSFFMFFPMLLNNTAFTFGGLNQVYENGYYTEARAALQSKHLLKLDKLKAETEQKQAENQKKKDVLKARRVQHELDGEEYNLTGEIQNSDYNEVSTAERIESYSNLFQRTPDITYRPATCKISQVKIGAYKYCLSPEEDPKPMTPTKCGFECVPDLSLAEYEAAMVIYNAKDRLGEFYRNFVGVKAWFKLFNVIGHHNAKVKFAQVFDKELGIICSAMEGRKFSHLESVKNVCGPFYKGSTPLLSDKAFSDDLYLVM